MKCPLEIDEAVSSKSGLIGWRLRVGTEAYIIFLDQDNMPGIRNASDGGFVSALDDKITYRSIEEARNDCGIEMIISAIKQRKSDAAVDSFCEAMKKRLDEKAAEGYTGWDGEYPSIRLAEEIHKDVIQMVGSYTSDDVHTEKVVDIANRCMMLWYRTGEQPKGEE